MEHILGATTQTRKCLHLQLGSEEAGQQPPLPAASSQAKDWQLSPTASTLPATAHPHKPPDALWAASHISSHSEILRISCPISDGVG